MGVTEAIAGFVKDRTFDDFPPEAVEMSKRAIMDCLGVAVAGSAEESTGILKQYLAEHGGAGKCLVPVIGLTTTVPLAALIFGTMAHALDYDDINLSMHGHPSVPLVPVILALGDSLNITGKRAIEAYIVGFEAQAKTGLLLGRDPYERGWHYTMTVGVIGAAAAAAKILDLSREQIRVALGIAASMTGGLRQNFGTMTKPFHAGLAAQNGVVAALLSQKGFTADPGILEAPFGMKQVISEGETMPEEVVIERLEGNELDIIFPGIGFKKYPCCYMSHQAIDAILAIIHEHDVRAEDVEQVRVGVNSLIPKELIHRRPSSPLEAKFSMEFAMAIALLDRRVGLAQFTREKVKAALPLFQRVEMYVRGEDGHEKGLSSLKSLVEVRLRNGASFINEVQIPRGYPMNPLSREELEEKFDECMGAVFSDDVIRQCTEYMRRIESLDNLGVLTMLLQK